MPLSIRALALGALLTAAVPTRAHACSGPCTSPELWGLVPLGATPLIVTNFGLLSTADGGWKLTCEEVIGGILLAVESNATHAVVSTDIGLFVGSDGLCGFDAGPTSARSRWFLDVAIAADSTARSPHLLGLVSDASASSINVELAHGDNFQILHELGSETAYRHLETSNDFGTIVAAGYASGPRRWRLAWSADSGQSWREFTPDLGAPSASALLMGLDPKDPDRLFFQVQGTDATPAELWSFRASTEAATRLFTLEADHAVTGMTFVGAELWLSSKAPRGGGLYRAALPDLVDFAPVLEEVPKLACVGVVDDQPFVCADDYSTNSPFLLAKVNTVARRFEPVLELDDLGKLKDCGAECQSTHQWLEEVYGAGTDTGSDTTGETTSETPPEPPARSDDGGCALRGASPGAGLWVPSIFGLLGLVAWRRRHRFVT